MKNTPTERGMFANIRKLSFGSGSSPTKNIEIDEEKTANRDEKWICLAITQCVKIWFERIVTNSFRCFSSVFPFFLFFFVFFFFLRRFLFHPALFPFFRASLSFARLHSPFLNYLNWPLSLIFSSCNCLKWSVSFVHWFYNKMLYKFAKHEQKQD